jgi:hypothetical protein
VTRAWSGTDRGPAGASGRRATVRATINPVIRAPGASISRTHGVEAHADAPLGGCRAGGALLAGASLLQEGRSSLAPPCHPHRLITCEEAVGSPTDINYRHGPGPFGRRALAPLRAVASRSSIWDASAADLRTVVRHASSGDTVSQGNSLVSSFSRCVVPPSLPAERRCHGLRADSDENTAGVQVERCASSDSQQQADGREPWCARRLDPARKPLNFSPDPARGT